MAKFSTYSFEAQLDVAELKIRDRGDLSPEGITDAAKESHEQNKTTIFLGGDNAVTRRAANGLGDLTKVGLITLDAHLDLRDLSLGEINGNPIRGLLKDGLPGENIYQVGLSSFANSPKYVDVAKKAGIRFVTAEAVQEHSLKEVMHDVISTLVGKVDVIYVDFDIDVLDRSYVPGCPGARPGGLMPWQLREAARLLGQNAKVRMVDVVEVDPEKDINECTVQVAASVVLEFLAGVATRSVR